MQARALDVLQNLWLRGHILQTLACFLTRGLCGQLCLLCSVRAAKTCFVLGLRTGWNSGHGTQRDKRISLSEETLEHLFFFLGYVQSLCFRHGQPDKSSTCLSDDRQCLSAQLQDISVTNGPTKRSRRTNWLSCTATFPACKNRGERSGAPKRTSGSLKRSGAPKRTSGSLKRFGSPMRSGPPNRSVWSLLVIELHSALHPGWFPCPPGLSISWVLPTVGVVERL